MNSYNNQRWPKRTFFLLVQRRFWFGRWGVRRNVRDRRGTRARSLVTCAAAAVGAQSFLAFANANANANAVFPTIIPMRISVVTSARYASPIIQILPVSWKSNNTLLSCLYSIVCFYYSTTHTALSRNSNLQYYLVIILSSLRNNYNFYQKFPNVIISLSLFWQLSIYYYFRVQQNY